MPHELSVLSFNAWLLSPVRVDIAKDVARRAALIPAAVAQLGPDIVALQEVWGRRWRRVLVEGFAKVGYGAAAYSSVLPRPSRYRAVLGNGLLIVSKRPITNVLDTLVCRRFTAAEEFFVGKGAVRVEVPCGELTTDLYNVHLGAVGFDRAADRYVPRHAQVRSAQIRELVGWVRATHQPERPLIIAADLNLHANRYGAGGFGPEEQEDYAYLVQALDLEDTARTLGALDAQGRPFTFDAQQNPYAVLGFFRDLPSETIDYVFAGRHPRIRPIASKVVFRDPEELTALAGAAKTATVPALSDHYGILTTFRIG